MPSDTEFSQVAGRAAPRESQGVVARQVCDRRVLARYAAFVAMAPSRTSSTPPADKMSPLGFHPAVRADKAAGGGRKAIENECSAYGRLD